MPFQTPGLLYTEDWVPQRQLFSKLLSVVAGQSAQALDSRSSVRATFLSQLALTVPKCLSPNLVQLNLIQTWNPFSKVSTLGHLQKNKEHRQ